ncbi:MAG: hypothetical protein EOM25_07920 [Deltaproteobacteria bacterium]|nr:hypothetical protein [Deltaproteobacteria bacterium]
MKCSTKLINGRPCPREATEGKELCSFHDRKGKLTYIAWEGDFRPLLRGLDIYLRDIVANLRRIRSERNINKYSGGAEFPNALVASETLLERLQEVQDSIDLWRETL